eukprot:CAMPEP_0119014698 /NCGR_PEP_ID=MMETSP1176-20130426/10237_1 /TAXON_ID=265551 /ORGANISM="Synedropsis recta cf, Strain CCMP1620" /LENGTH=140 /DNA_ID=CAMNT_0006967921 /DNA_START=82 /DNA_END=504 /DNA_ORIENTATION=+
MKVLQQIALLTLLFSQVAAFSVVGPATPQRTATAALSMSPTDKDTSTDASTDADAPAEGESPAPEKWASEVKPTDPRYEENEDDSPVMKAGKALKPLNDVIETITSSPLLTPVLLLAPTLGNPKVRAGIADFFHTLTQSQ